MSRVHRTGLLKSWSLPSKQRNGGEMTLSVRSTLDNDYTRPASNNRYSDAGVTGARTEDDGGSPVFVAAISSFNWTERRQHAEPKLEAKPVDGWSTRSRLRLHRQVFFVENDRIQALWTLWRRSGRWHGHWQRDGSLLAASITFTKSYTAVKNYRLLNVTSARRYSDRAC